MGDRFFKLLKKRVNYSAKAVIVKPGFIPGFAGIIEPFTINRTE
jgi:hypothetical protein